MLVKNTFFSIIISDTTDLRPSSLTLHILHMYSHTLLSSRRCYEVFFFLSFRNSTLKSDRVVNVRICYIVNAEKMICIDIVATGLIPELRYVRN